MIEVRTACPEDFQALAHLGLEAWKRGIGPLVAPSVVAKMERANPFLSFLEDQNCNILVAVIAGVPIGFAACEGRDNHISDVWVSPGFEGRGCATALIGALTTRIFDRGYEDATIEVAADNTRAHRLYLHLGFVEEWRGMRRDPLLGAELVKVRMRTRLSP
ncbi:GNAT family N-acetyltransferase [Shimia sp. R10_1]|uniref:GNAT family N-acetyltransferase n=1 Tax=Shimia sp. R10_1 TaxID=2821095 RepID=UPI001ADCDCBA|nr:N-acetyltransferase [Shimia sp. R10_1]MBO9473589.1 GNAT family N-acetyltransferase [Shimia sp. R10_1]